MEGNEAAFNNWLTAVAMGCQVRGETCHYLEIGVAEGKTMRQACRILDRVFAPETREEFGRDVAGMLGGTVRRATGVAAKGDGKNGRHGKNGRGWAAYGIDIEGGWSLGAQEIGRQLERWGGAIVETGEATLTHYRGLRRDGLSPHPYVFLTGSAVELAHPWPALDFVFVDGCHGKACVKRDFISLHGLMREGGIVAFHDASVGCQGMHMQPHCGTGIAVRQGLTELGLFANEIEGWKFLGETSASHGVAFFQKVGVREGDRNLRAETQRRGEEGGNVLQKETKGTKGGPVLRSPAAAGEGGFQMEPYPEEAKGIELFGKGGWTPKHEVRVLVWLARKTVGPMLEIGCNNGQTTREMAMRFPGRKVVGVDYTGDDFTMCMEQAGEGKPGKVAEMALGLPNVRALDMKSSNVNYFLIEPGLVFIDGDHSYTGVKVDTEKALDYFRASGKSGMIVWHDCCETHPSWVGVLDYLKREIAPFYQVRRVEGTWLAYLRV